MGGEFLVNCLKRGREVEGGSEREGGVWGKALSVNSVKENWRDVENGALCV